MTDKRLWSEEATAELRRMWAEKVPAGIIAERFGLTKSAILGKKTRLGLEYRGSKCDWTEAHDADLRRLWAEGVSMRRIAEIIGGRSKRAVQTRAVFLKLPERVVIPERSNRLPNPKPPRPVFDPNAVYPDPVTNRPCQFIPGEPSLDEGCKCGKPARVNSSYCPAHHYLCWTAPTPKRLGGNKIDREMLRWRKQRVAA
jgi:hypothetical protein